MSDPTLTLDEAAAIMERYEKEEAAKKKKKDETTKEVKDLIVEGAKQGRGGLGLGTKTQLEILEEEGY